MKRILKDSGYRDPAVRTAQRKSGRDSAPGDLSSRIAGSPLMTAQRRKLQSLFGGAAQLQEESASRPNNTGLPDNLKSGIENLSGMSMDHVKVHYDSSMPAQLNALAYAQGSDIHVAPGQEKHLPHEAWHVVQQAQGRVKPTMQMKGGVALNDDRGLEREADAMGARALQMRVAGAATISASSESSRSSVIQRAKIEANRLNVAGEDHDESDKRRFDERRFALQEANGMYWNENEFGVEISIGETKGEVDADSLSFRWLQIVSFILDINSLSSNKEGVQRLVSWINELAGVHESLDNLSEADRARVDSRLNFTEIKVTVAEIQNHKTFIEKITEIRERLKGKLNKENKKNYDIEDEKADLFQLNLGLADVLKFDPAENSKKITLDRSMLMWGAANQHGNRLGIWKIGDAHVQDIKDRNKDISTFNLLSRKEFNESYEEWWRVNDDLTQGHPVVNEGQQYGEQQFVNYRGFYWTSNFAYWWDGYSLVDANKTMPWMEHEGVCWMSDGQWWDNEISQWRPSNEYKNVGNKKRKLEDGGVDDNPNKKRKLNKTL